MKKETKEWILLFIGMTGLVLGIMVIGILLYKVIQNIK